MTHSHHCTRCGRFLGAGYVCADGECPSGTTADLCEYCTGCDHPRMSDPTGPRAGECLECGARCSCRDESETDYDCPIHGD